MPIIIGFGGIKSRVNPSNPCGSVPQCFTYQKNLSALTTSLIVAAIEDWHIFVASKLLCVIHKLSCRKSMRYYKIISISFPVFHDFSMVLNSIFSRRLRSVHLHPLMVFKPGMRIRFWPKKTGSGALYPKRRESIKQIF